MGEWADSNDWRFLPPRYYEDWRRPLHEMSAAFLRPGGRVLDFGGGANPIIPPEMRPDGVEYVGIDVSREELERAPEGSYDELIVGDIAGGILGEASYEVVVSWQVLEHVADMAAALEGIRAALKPGGALVAQLSGSRAFFAMLNRMVPDRLGEFAMQRLLGREPESVFSAPYDRCTKSELEQITGAWADVEIIPRFRGASYLGFAKPLARLYVVYENRLVGRGKDDSATHYLMRLVK